MPTLARFGYEKMYVMFYLLFSHLYVYHIAILIAG